MEISLSMLPMDEQDRLEEGLLKADGGHYFSVYKMISAEIEGMQERVVVNVRQDKLEDGLVKAALVDSYHPIGLIQKFSLE